jgi:hypothetical protein
MRSPRVKWDNEYLERGSGREYRGSSTPSPCASRTSSVCASPEPGDNYSRTSAYPSGPRLPSPQAYPESNGSARFLPPSLGSKEQRQASSSPEPAHIFSEFFGTVEALIGRLGQGSQKIQKLNQNMLSGSCIPRSAMSTHKPQACVIVSDGEPDTWVTSTPRDAFIPERLDFAKPKSSPWLDQSPKDPSFVRNSSHPGTRKPQPSPAQISRAVLRSPPSPPPALSVTMPVLNQDDITGAQVLKLVNRAQYLEQKFKYMETKPPKLASFSEMERYKQGLVVAKEEWEQADYEAEIASQRMMKQQARISSPDIRRTSTT